ncbi:Calcium ion binding [Quillaja saponaria]|uniref:Calcium ion binding n=1 Tax=Quillaja saponaria TaxID=32244 RepID=A0AAD7PZT8_QUISA|nr:Calcium ion binding [Quillaja saponaria]
MAFYKTSKAKPKPRSPIHLFAIAITAIAILFLFSSIISTKGSSSSFSKALDNVVKPRNGKQHRTGHEKYLYWGDRIDCPGKHCESCEGLGHQESSLRCALEEAFYLQRTFVMPSRMCINPIHNKKGILHQSSNASSEERWTASSCAMDSLYDTDLISDTIPVILDNSKEWYKVLSTVMKLGARGVAHLERVSRVDLKQKSQYSNLLLINRTASPLSWFMECKDRNNRSSVMLPYSFLPSVAAKRLRDCCNKDSYPQIKALLGDYDAIHVRRGDKIKTRKDRFGVQRSLHPHLDRDTRPEFILSRIEKWVPPGRMLFIASNERTPGFFSPLSTRYKMAYSSNFSQILDAVVENNYQLFMIERVILMGAKTSIKTFKENDADLSLTDDPKKNTKAWQIPVYTADEKREWHFALVHRQWQLSNRKNVGNR